MRIKNLKLKNFRNFKSFELRFGVAPTLIIGPNGSGKSNLLEAIYLLASGQSLRAEFDSEMILFGLDFAKVIAEVSTSGQELNLDLTLNLSAEGRVSKKTKVNGVARALNKFAGSLQAVAFAPEDLLLVSGAPELRRRYLNAVLAQVSFEYRANLRNYEKARHEKNQLLENVQEGRAQEAEISIWNEQLLKFGQPLQKEREKYLQLLSQNEKGLDFAYRPSLFNLGRLEEFWPREIGAGVCLIGPHRDDFEFIASQGHPLRDSRGGLRETNLSHYGSRGQKRLAVFELKLGELNFLRSTKNDEPLLILDDIFSELDEDHRRQVLGRLEVKKEQQVIYTATDTELVDDDLLAGFEVVRL